jgi:hypothetical protein
LKHAAPQLFTGASAPKKKVFVGPIQSRRIRRTFSGNAADGVPIHGHNFERMTLKIDIFAI